MMGFLIDKVTLEQKDEEEYKQRVYHYSDEALNFFERLRAKKTAELLDKKGYSPEEVEEIIEKMREEEENKKEVKEKLDKMARGGENDDGFSRQGGS